MAGAMVTGVCSPNTVRRRVRPNGSVEVHRERTERVDAAPSARDRVRELDDASRRRGSPEPTAGNAPRAVPSRPWGACRCHVPGGVGKGGAHADPDATTVASRPTVRDIRRQRPGHAVGAAHEVQRRELAASTASSRMPKYMSSRTPISLATMKQTIAEDERPRAAHGQRPQASHDGLTAGGRAPRAPTSGSSGDRHAHARGDALEDRRDGVGSRCARGAARRAGGDEPVRRRPGRAGR